jgi:DNA ligase (NAD+)
MGLKEWGETLIERLVSLGLIKDVADLYGLTEGQLAQVDRMGARSAKKVLETLWGRCRVPLETLLGSLSIPLCGESTIKMATCAGFDTLDRLCGADVEQLSAVGGLGPVKASALWRWLQAHRGLVDRLLESGVEIEPKVYGSLSGKSVCFTGSLSQSRKDLEALVVQAGGEVKKSVTRTLTYLVMADPNSSSTKAKAARKNGTTCLSEDSFLTLVGSQ